MSHKGLEHMMVPCQPRPSFIVIHSDFAFCFFEGSFDRPAQTTDADQLLSRAMRRCIAQIELQFGLGSQAAATNEPLADGWQAVVDGSHTQECKVCHQGTFAAFMDEVPMPGSFREAHYQHAKFFRRRRIAFDAPMQAGTTHEATTRLFHQRSAQTRVSLGTSAMYHLCIAAIFCEKAGFFP